MSFEGSSISERNDKEHTSRVVLFASFVAKETLKMDSEEDRD